MQENLKKLKDVNRNLRREIRYVFQISLLAKFHDSYLTDAYMFVVGHRQRMGDCMNDLTMEDLRLLEEEMDKAAKAIRERKVRFNFC